MQLVVDANVLFSALIKSGATRRILLLSEHDLYAPEFMVDEFKKHLPELQKKTHLQKDKLAQNLETLLQFAEIKLVPFKEFKHKQEPASKISPDKGDIAYFALALYLQCRLWSQDKRLKKQNKVNIVTTKELLEHNL